MTATWTSSDLSIRVEVPDSQACILFSGNHGQAWQSLTVREARELARGLCAAADRVEDAETEAERSAA